MDASPEHQFYFWLGTWDVTWGENEKGTNRIERIMGGKIIQENFDAPDLKGMSVSAYDAERGLWCQTWVDNSGSYLDFSGTFENGKMILVRDAFAKSQSFKQRMVWFDIEANALNWNWERSDDGGQTWRVVWSIRYIRRKG